MRPTDPPPPQSERASQTLIEELCLALRDVGVRSQFLPYGGPLPDLAFEVERVRTVANELRLRAVDVTERLDTLTQETQWQMRELFSECMRYPETHPWVRDAKSGLRIALRCEGCGTKAFPEQSRRLRLCDDCLTIMDTALATAKPMQRLLLYRTYTPEARCEHAGDDTVLGVYPWTTEWSEDFPVGFCRTCLSLELARRRAG